MDRALITKGMFIRGPTHPVEMFVMKSDEPQPLTEIARRLDAVRRKLAEIAPKRRS